MTGGDGEASEGSGRTWAAGLRGRAAMTHKDIHPLLWLVSQMLLILSTSSTSIPPPNLY